VNSIFHDLIHELLGGPIASVTEHWRFGLDLLTVDRIIAGGSSIAVRFHSSLVMHAEHGLHEMR
jgi:hypothetical protein